MKKFIFLALLSSLAGCGYHPAAKTVDWYKEHPVERKAMLANCKSHFGQIGESANCVNAQQADNQNANARRGWVTPDAVDFGKKGG